MCIFPLKDILDKYKSQNFTVFICSIDASKAFDHINHKTLFNKLCQKGIFSENFGFLVWTSDNVNKMGKLYISSFYVSNGVRQGNLLSPFLFNLYMDDLSVQLNWCGTGCMVSNSLINHLMDADDLVIFSGAGLQHLLRICSQYGIDF